MRTSEFVRYISNEMVEQELRPAACEQRQRFKDNYSIERESIVVSAPAVLRQVDNLKP